MTVGELLCVFESHYLGGAMPEGVARWVLQLKARRSDAEVTLAIPDLEVGTTGELVIEDHPLVEGEEKKRFRTEDCVFTVGDVVCSGYPVERAPLDMSRDYTVNDLRAKKGWRPLTDARGDVAVDKKWLGMEKGPKEIDDA